MQHPAPSGSPYSSQLVSKQLSGAAYTMSTEPERWARLGGTITTEEAEAGPTEGDVAYKKSQLGNMA